MISSNRANVVPPPLLLLCLLLITARFASIVYDAYWAPQTVALIKWQKPVALDPKTGDFSGNPYLLYFVDTSDLFSRLKAEAFEGWVFRNRQVAGEMNQDYRCVKIDLADKKDPAVASLSKMFHVTSWTPDVIVSLANGRKMNTSDMQMTDRLYYLGLIQTRHNAYKAAADAYMQHCDYKHAVEDYTTFLKFPDTTMEAQIHAMVREYFALNMLGKEAEAEKVLTHDYEKLSKDYYDGKCLQFLAGDIDEKKFQDDYCKENSASGKYILGMAQLIEGKKEEAITNLKWVAERGSIYNPDTLLARAELARLGIATASAVTEEEADESTAYSHYYD